MARMARVAAAGLPHPIAQRGSGRMQSASRGLYDDELVTVEPMQSIVGDWVARLALNVDEAEQAALRRHERTGRPLGAPEFVQRLEHQLKRPLQPQKRGPKGSRKDIASIDESF